MIIIQYGWLIPSGIGNRMLGRRVQEFMLHPPKSNQSTFGQMNFRSNDLLRNFFSVKWHFLSKVDSVKWPFSGKKSVIWPFDKMNFRSNRVRLNGDSVKWCFGQTTFGQTVFGQMVLRSNGLSVKWCSVERCSVKWCFGQMAFGLKNSVKWLFGKVIQNPFLTFFQKISGFFRKPLKRIQNKSRLE
jgi:hypothetical protein